MAVTQTLRALGRWDLSLRESMPAEVWKGIDYFGHIVIHMGRTDPRVAGDSLLRSARYTGVLRGKSESGMPKQISGLDIAMWLGDPDNKADIIETALNVSGDFSTVINQTMSGFDAVQVGTVFNDTGPFTATFQFQSRRQVIDYICQTWGGKAWRVNGDATLDAGNESYIFVVNPKVSVVRKGKYLPDYFGSEVDMFLRSLNGNLDTTQDVEDLTTRVLLMAQGSNGEFASATADAPPGYFPYTDLHGNPIKLTRIVQESETDAGNADARAQLQLNRFLGTRDALTLSTEFYDVSGVARVGDYLWVHDPEMGLVDPANEVIFHGQRMNPMKLQMTETSWPIVRGMSVAYRHWDGSWLDLTDYVEWESGSSSIVVGGYNRSLTEGGSGAFPITQPDVNTTIPGVPTWNDPFLGAVYQSPGSGETKAETILSWNKPNNTDSSIITDGDHYEIRYRQSSLPFFPIVWQQVMDTYDVWDNWEASGATWDYPLLYASTALEWQIAVAPFDVTTFRLQELTPSMPYEAQIRAIDNGRPANMGAWSDLVLFQAINDNLPPATPAPPDIEANPMAVLMVHTLGRSDGGTYNLDRDLHHLELHGGTEPLFTPTIDTLLGKVLANYGMMIGQIPVVGSFQITSLAPVYFKVVAVDEAGNKSLPSTAVGAVAELISSQYIQSLTADKIVAGTMMASIIVGGRIATMLSGSFPGVELSFAGIKGLGTLGQTILDWQSNTGKLIVNGRGGIEIVDGALTVKNASGNVILEAGECLDGRHGLQVYKDDGTRVARVGELASGSEGIEVIDDTGKLVRVDTLAFGTRADSVSTQESTSANSYVNLATLGPFTTVPIGNSGRCVVILSARINGPGTIFNASVGFDMAGPSGYLRSANVFESQWIAFSSPNGDNFAATVSLSKVILITGLPSAGNYTVQMKYWTNGTSHSFGDRHIVAIPF